MIRPITVLLFALFFTCHAGASAPAGFRVELPYENINGKMMVKARIGGIEGRFLFDTGAPVCITCPMAQRLNLPEGETMGFGDSNGQRVENKVVDMDEIKLGGVGFTNVKAVVFRPGEMIESFGVDGIIGYTLFSTSIVEIDGKRQVIVITNSPDGMDMPTSAACPMVGDQPYLAAFHVNLNGTVTDQVMFDCGAAGFYDLSENSFNKLKEKKAFKVLAKGSGILSFGAAGLEEKAEKYRINIPAFTIGAGRFSNVTSVTTTSKLSRLGSGILKFGKVTIDYPRQQFYFIPYEKNPVDVYQKEWNVVITVINNELTAGFVWGNMKKSLEGGEKIVEVNGKRFDKVDPYLAMTTNLVNLSGDEAEIVIVDKKSGREKKLTIRRE